MTPSETMTLGPKASASQVLQAMCADYTNKYGTDPITISAEQLAAAYYGWHFTGVDPVSEFETEGCTAA